MFSSRSSHPVSITRQPLSVAAWMVMSFYSFPALAQVQTLGDMTTSVYDSFLSLQVFLAVVAFCVGTWYVMKGVQMLRGAGEGGNQAPSISQSLFKLGGGGALISLPFIINLVMTSVASDAGGGIGQSVEFAGDMTRSFSGPGLDHALGRFVVDFFVPFMGDALPFFCYIAGTILMIRGIQRLANGDGKGPTAPGGLGTFSIFIIAAVLMSLGYLMRTLQGSIFGETTLYANVTLKYASASALTERAQHVLWAIFQFLRIVGYISVIRGLFMLKNNTEGGNQSMTGAVTHIIAGAMLANVWYFIWVVQNTFVDDPDYFVFEQPS